MQFIDHGTNIKVDLVKFLTAPAHSDLPQIKSAICVSSIINTVYCFCPCLFSEVPLCNDLKKMSSFLGSL